MKYVPPSITLTAFNCPHCDVLTSQTWYSLDADSIPRNGIPDRIDKDESEKLRKDLKPDERADKPIDTGLLDKILSNAPCLGSPNTQYQVQRVYNVNVSKCYDCDRLSVWVGNELIWPDRGDAPLANPDLSDDVRADYSEASRILQASPRGAAALLRLAIQKLCKELGEKGKNIDDDIKALVEKGLPIPIQRALDIVRVIGNEAVHPGQIDLKDDVGTAEQLFRLINLIADRMVSHPKQIDEMYGNLPESKREAIERRDAEAMSKKP